MGEEKEKFYTVQELATQNKLSTNTVRLYFSILGIAPFTYTNSLSHYYSSLQARILADMKEFLVEERKMGKRVPNKRYLQVVRSRIPEADNLINSRQSKKSKKTKEGERPCRRSVGERPSRASGETPDVADSGMREDISPIEAKTSLGEDALTKQSPWEENSGKDILVTSDSSVLPSTYEGESLFPVIKSENIQKSVGTTSPVIDYESNKERQRKVTEWYQCLEEDKATTIFSQAAKDGNYGFTAKQIKDLTQKDPSQVEVFAWGSFGFVCRTTDEPRWYPLLLDLQIQRASFSIPELQEQSPRKIQQVIPFIEPCETLGVEYAASRTAFPPIKRKNQADVSLG